MTQLDKELQQIAINNWQEFVELISDDAIEAAKICYLRTYKSKSYGEIKNQMGITVDAVRWGVSKCCTVQQENKIQPESKTVV